MAAEIQYEILVKVEADLDSAEDHDVKHEIEEEHSPLNTKGYNEQRKKSRLTAKDELTVDKVEEKKRRKREASKKRYYTLRQTMTPEQLQERRRKMNERRHKQREEERKVLMEYVQKCREQAASRDLENEETKKSQDNCSIISNDATSSPKERSRKMTGEQILERRITLAEKAKEIRASEQKKILEHNAMCGQDNTASNSSIHSLLIPDDAPSPLKKRGKDILVEKLLERIRRKDAETSRKQWAEETRILMEHKLKGAQKSTVSESHLQSTLNADDAPSRKKRGREITVEKILERKRKDAETKRKRKEKEKRILMEYELMGGQHALSINPEQSESQGLKEKNSHDKSLTIVTKTSSSKKLGQNVTAEDILERRRKYAERIRDKRALLRAQGIKQKPRIAYSQQISEAEMTEEELKRHKMEKYLYYHARYRNKTQYRDLSEEKKEKRRKCHREWTRNLTAEKRERYKESVSRAQKKHFAKMKEENREEWINRKEKLKEYMRRKVAAETPDERLRRRHMYKVNAAAKKLKQQLTSEQVDVEEIERKVTELKTTMWKEFDPDYDKRPPKPRGRPKKKVTLPHENKPLFETADHGSIPFVASASVEKQDAGVNDFSDTFTNYTDTYGTEAVDCIDEYESHFSPCASPLSASSPQPYLSIHSMPDDTTHSSSSTVQCLYCSSVFFGDDLLRTHVCLVHDDKCWKCPICKEVVLSPTELSQHFKSSHNTVQQQSTEKQESDVNDKTKYVFVCMRCSPTDNCRLSKFKSRKELFTHVMTKHSHHFWPCKHCSLLKYREETLKFHLKICSNLKNVPK